ncbi:MAG: hypothetical protein LBU36_00685 [Clostridiales bacterium]|jgi:hypothetical protein|nr:hypothetical protein [Clostridiales bacterium]
MLDVRNAHTTNADEISEAVKELLAQLDIPTLKSYTAGILFAHEDYLKTGVVSAVCAKLPFDVIGAPVIKNETEKFSGNVALTMTVLTSDDVFLSAGLTGPLSPPDANPIKEAVAKAKSAFPAGARVKMAFDIAPTAPHLNMHGNFFVNAFTEALRGKPHFGLFSGTSYPDTENRVIFNGELYSDRAAFILIGGNIEPKFIISELPRRRFLHFKGVITDSLGTEVTSVDHIPANKWLYSIGFLRSPEIRDQMLTLTARPFIIDAEDGTMPILGQLVAVADGRAIFGVDVPRGAAIYVAEIMTEQILTQAAVNAARQAAEFKPSLCLAMLCIGRYLIFDSMLTEFDEIRRVFKQAGDIPFHITTADGEFAPVPKDDGTEVNKHHNYTLAICAL